MRLVHVLAAIPEWVSASIMNPLLRDNELLLAASALCGCVQSAQIQITSLVEMNEEDGYSGTENRKFLDISMKNAMIIVRDCIMRIVDDREIRTQDGMTAKELGLRYSKHTNLSCNIYRLI